MRRLRERTLFRILVAVVIAEPLLRFVAVHFARQIDIHYKTPFVLDFIAYGALLSLLIRSQRIHTANVARIGGTIIVVSAVLAGLAIWVEAFHMNASLDALFALPFTWGACGIILLGIKRDHTRLERLGRTDGRGVLAFYGYISYGLYLVHVFVNMKLGVVIGRHINPAAFQNFFVYSAAAFACIVVSTALAYLSRRFFEGPILSLKDKWQDHFARPVSISKQLDDLQVIRLATTDRRPAAQC